MEIFGDESADVPDVAPLQTGKLSDKTRKFDLVCSGRCKIGDEFIPLKMEGHDIPDLFTIDENGDVAVTSPKPMTTITMPKGHRSFIKITLTSILGEASGVSNWVHLGVRQKGEITDTLHTSQTKELTVAMFSEDAVELVPLVSGQSGSYLKVEPGTKISEISGFPKKTGDIKFGAVYRVSVDNLGAWTSIELKDHPSGYNMGSLGIGPIHGQEGDQLLALSGTTYHLDGRVAYSSDGLTWFCMDSVIDENVTSGWYAAPKYGNGVWCVVNCNYSDKKGIRRSTDGALTWQQANEGDPGRTIAAECLAFDNGVFMTIDYNTGYVYTSEKANVWTKIGESLKSCNMLIYGNSKWICGNRERNLQQSIDGGRTWQSIENSDLKSQMNDIAPCGGCYANGYFYLVATRIGTAVTSKILRSISGVHWVPCVEKSSYMPICNVTYYGRLLYTYNSEGLTTSNLIGLP